MAVAELDKGRGVLPEFSSYSEQIATRHFAATVMEIEAVSGELGIDKRFVGGILPLFLNRDTEFEIDIPHRTVILRRTNPLSAFRSDGTVRDLDLLCNCENEDTVNKFKKRVHQYQIEQTQFGMPEIPITIEPTRYYGEGKTWKRRNRLKQFVSTINNVDGTFNFNFESITVPVTDASLGPWTIVIDDYEINEAHEKLHFTTFHPLAHFLRYCMRNASGIRPKDKGEKLSQLFRLGMAVTDAEMAADPERYEYEHMKSFGPWIHFIESMLTDKSLPIRLKRDISRVYWNRYGEKIAHGVGKLKFLTRYADRFA